MRFPNLRNQKAVVGEGILANLGSLHDENLSSEIEFLSRHVERMDSHPALVLLRTNASLQIFCSTLLGSALLLPMQPWFPFKLSPKLFKEMISVHLDLYMLAFMQFSAASVLENQILTDTMDQARILVIARLLRFGGWVNPSAYLFRGFGINAFTFGSDLKQNLATSLGAVSATSIVVAWGMILNLVKDKYGSLVPIF